MNGSVWKGLHTWTLLGHLLDISYPPSTQTSLTHLSTQMSLTHLSTKTSLTHLSTQTSLTHPPPRRLSPTSPPRRLLPVSPPRRLLPLRLCVLAVLANRDGVKLEGPSLAYAGIQLWRGLCHLGEGEKCTVERRRRRGVLHVLYSSVVAMFRRNLANTELSYIHENTNPIKSHTKQKVLHT